MFICQQRHCLDKLCLQKVYMLVLIKILSLSVIMLEKFSFRVDMLFVIFSFWSINDGDDDSINLKFYWSFFAL